VKVVPNLDVDALWVSVVRLATTNEPTAVEEEKVRAPRRGTLTSEIVS